MVRLAPEHYLKLIQADSFDVSYAGAEANVAVSLANYGVDADFVTCLPNNPVAERCIMSLRGHKVGVENIQRSGNRIGILYLETGSNFRPSKVYYDREGSSMANVELGSIDWENILKDADWFHWTGITPAISRNAAIECLNAIKVCNKKGITVSCDINYRGNLWKYGQSASEIMPELVAGCDLIMGNEEDCEKVFGIKAEGFDSSDSEGKVDSESFRSVCEQMMSRFSKCKKMVVTLRGAVNANHNSWQGILFDGDKLYKSKRYDITHIVDRVGGGDSFMGAFIFALNHYKNDHKALEFATAASCLKHTIHGDFNYASVEDVENLMNGDTNGRVKR